MFNFHKPRVYRSADGCCICRAKSSSSRFTASRKYEKESMQCFNLHEPRNGEICNACVLLVKRYKRLPVGSKRHWGHVVDARAGPGTKSLAKQKKREIESEAKANAGSSSSFIPEKFAKIFKKNRKGKSTAANGQSDMPAAIAPVDNRAKSTSPTLENPSDSNESYDEERAQTPPTCASSMPLTAAAPYQTRKRTAAAALAANVNGTICAQLHKPIGSKRRRMLMPMKNRRAVDNVPFFEKDDLIRLDVCCGIVFQSLSLGSHCFIIDTDLYKPCEKHRKMRQHALEQQLQQKEQQSNVFNNSSIVKAPAMANNNNTPALKKHHLFFKRQSESFPQGDINRISPIPLTKTEPLSTTNPIITTATSNYMPPHHSNKLPATNSLIIKPTASKLLEGVNSAVILHPTVAITTTAVGAASPSSLSSSSNCSTSSSVATKFNDNSSDSGFDEHVLERKSVSPPTQDELQLDKKARSGASNAGMHRLILASGLPITGQAQNLVLAGNEFTARFVQQRQQLPAATASVAVSAGGAGSPPTAAGAVKMNVLGSQTNGGTSSSNSNLKATPKCNKMRAIFNAANTIQHENGVTTILPASSLAASNQTAAMNAIAPSTVTITPAPGGGVVKKIAQTLPLTISNAGNTVVANPKFILLKPGTAKFAANNNNSSTVDAKIA